MAEFIVQQPAIRSEVPSGPGDARTPLLQSRDSRKRDDAVLSGKVNWVGDFTLAAGVAFTVVVDDRVTSDCEISLQPLTADAASIAGKVYVGVANLTPGTSWAANPVGRFSVQHPIVSTDQFQFRYSIKG